MEKRGKDVCLWLIHVDVWQKPLQYCKVISFQLKKLINFKKEKRERKFKGRKIIETKRET